MNRLQNIKSRHDYFVSLNMNEKIDTNKIIRTIEYTHPFFDKNAINAQKVFGPEVGLLKGKSKRPKQAAGCSQNEWVEIPPEIYANHGDLNLHIDVMFVNTLSHLTTIDDPIKYRAAVPLESRANNELYKALDSVLRHYNQAGFYHQGDSC